MGQACLLSPESKLSIERQYSVKKKKKKLHENLRSASTLSSFKPKPKTYHCLLSNPIRVYLFVSCVLFYFSLFSTLILLFQTLNVSSYFVCLYCLVLLFLMSFLSTLNCLVVERCYANKLVLLTKTESPNHHA